MISILLPFHKADQFLLESIKSIICATFGIEYEVLLLGNNLNEKQLELFSTQFANLPSCFKFYNLGDITLVDALNFGIKNATFNYLARIDSDDLVDQKRFRAQIDLLDSDSNLGLVGSAAIIINPEGEEIGRSHPPLTNRQVRYHLKFGNCITHSSVMMRKNIALELGGYSNTFPGAEDFDLWTRLIRRSNVSILSTPLVSYRLHAGQTSNIVRHTQQISRIAVMLREAIVNGDFSPKSQMPRSATSIETWIREEMGPFWAFNFGKRKLVVFKIFQSRRLAGRIYIGSFKASRFDEKIEGEEEIGFLLSAILNSPNTTLKYVISSIILRLQPNRMVGK